ncbi:MAG: hypothetical protein EZS28_021805 [Streblomastix strix]|uniref:Uncharacterized protein n=1 Tax=Streblomastix strix TaxID=222440 RepID=A0A5J4VJJ9_9EUKA|nr:MAG: hypothetical protein EZS28_021805 [Streblomastix strix]
MLLASASDDGSMSLTDISQSIRPKLNDSIQIETFTPKWNFKPKSSNDKSRKQEEINIQDINVQQNANAITPKRITYDLGCLATGNNQGKITVYALPDPMMEMFDQMKKQENNKMFEIDAHSNSIWSIDESSQERGMFARILIPPTGQKLTQTRLASASSDGTVKLWNINTD